MTYTEQCVPLIRHIHCAMEKEANNKLREMDLTVSQIYLLQALNHAPDGTHTLTLKALEKQLQIGQSTTVGLVKRLQKKDFVTCTQSIDDKRIKKGQEEGTSMQEVARKFEAEYIRDSDGLNVKAPTVRPRATEHIGEIIHIVKDLVDSGHAYVARNGDVYFRG